MLITLCVLNSAHFGTHIGISALHYPSTVSVEVSWSRIMFYWCVRCLVSFADMACSIFRKYCSDYRVKFIVGIINFIHLCVRRIRTPSILHSYMHHERGYKISCCVLFEIRSWFSNNKSQTYTPAAFSDFSLLLALFVYTSLYSAIKSSSMANSGMLLPWNASLIRNRGTSATTNRAVWRRIIHRTNRGRKEKKVNMSVERTWAPRHRLCIRNKL